MFQLIFIIPTGLLRLAILPPVQFARWPAPQLRRRNPLALPAAAKE